MKRRGFLKEATVGLIAVVFLSALVNLLPATASAGDGQTNFTFVAVVVRQGGGGSDTIILTGAGSFNPAQVQGGGSFTHFDPGTTPPFTIIGSGTWKAKRLLSFTPTSPPTYGAHAAGVLEMEVNLVPAGGGVIPATVKVVCNISPGGLFTGQAEGVTLTLPGSVVFGTVPGGTTIFSPGVEQRD